MDGGQGHFVTSYLGDNMASVTWATKVSTKWVDQIDQLTDIFEEGWAEKGRRNGTEIQS